MVVFNTNTFVQLIIVAIPALIAMGIAMLVDGDSQRWAAITGAISLILVDGLWRLAAVGGGGDEAGEQAQGEGEGEGEGEEKEESVHGPLALVMPSGGGHIMFLPNWLVGGLVTYGLLSGFLSP